MGKYLKNPDLAPGALAARLPVTESSLGDSPVDGLIRFNQTNSQVELYYNGLWNQIAKIGKVSLVVDEFTGDSSTTTFTMSQSEDNDSDVLVTIGGVYQQPTTNYQITGTQIIFTSPPPAPGVNPNKIVVVHNLNSTAAV